MKHGQSMANTRKSGYGIWSSMKDRCRNPANKFYRNYGGRGIKVCDRWLHSFENFIADLGPRPSLKYSLDRYPNYDGNYDPGNCRWATRRQQDDNRRDTRIVQYRMELMSVRAAVEAAGNVAKVATANWRIKNGWPVDRAVETPSPGLM